MASVEVGSVSVATTSNKGHGARFWAEKATNKIVSVGSECHPVIAEQAEAFKGSVFEVVDFYIKQAIKSDRTTLIGELEQQGQNEMANIIRRL
mgnify:CR=1 FL=1